MEILQLQYVILCKIAVRRQGEGKDNGEIGDTSAGPADAPAHRAELLWKSQCCRVTGSLSHSFDSAAGTRSLMGRTALFRRYLLAGACDAQAWTLPGQSAGWESLKVFATAL